MPSMRSIAVIHSTVLLAALTLLAGIAHADSGGIIGYSGASGAICTACHSGQSAPIVRLDGPMELTPGATGQFTLTLLRTGANAFGGVNIAASAGTLTDTNAAGTRMQAGEITHSAPNDVPVDGKTWTFDWTAPAVPGMYFLRAAAASTDGTGTGGDGSSGATMVLAVLAGNQAPTASLVAVEFDASGSADADGTIVAYDWDFGDGSAGAGANVSHTFTAGIYTVTLTVTDDMGATATASHTITVSPADEPQPPVAMPGGPYTGTVGEPVQFDGSGSADADGGVVNYAWDFGDGGSGVTAMPTHTYTAAGTYTVTLTVTDSSALTATATTTAVISAQTPPPSPPPPGNGKDLYKQYCASCHGPGGKGGRHGSLVGDDAEDILKAIEEVEAMQFLKGTLSLVQIEAIADYLAKGKKGRDKKHCKPSSRAPDTSRHDRHKKHDRSPRADAAHDAGSVAGKHRKPHPDWSCRERRER